MNNGISKDEWWCGCYNETHFQSEDEFVKHMKGHKHNWSDSVLNGLRKTVHSMSFGGSK